MLSANGISFTIRKKDILHHTSVSFNPGKFHVIMGQNGAGKSTLLRILAGSEKPSSGKVTLHDKELGEYDDKELAINRAVLSQHYHISFPIPVYDVVMMGRYPYFGNTPSTTDHEICRKAMELMQVWDFSKRDYNTLSGGEAQKVMMSRVLAQVWENEKGANKILFLDEPVSHLDIRFQHQLMQVAKTFCEKHLTVIAVLHDMNLALRYADSFVLMKKGVIAHHITPDGLNENMLSNIFDADIRMKFLDGNRVAYTS